MLPNRTHTYAIRGMVCHRCDLAVARIAADTRVNVVGVTRGFVTFSRELRRDELHAFAAALEAIEFGLIRDADERLAEEVEVALTALAEQRPIPQWPEAHAALQRMLTSPYDYAARAFQRVHDATVAERLTALRIARAAALLRECELQISEISAAVGYRHLSGFSRAFKRVYGVSPRGWG